MVKLSIVLISVGVFFILLSALKTRDTLVMLKGKTGSNSWRALFYMILFFLAGYVAAICFILRGQKENLILLMGIVFLLGSLFAFIVTRISFFTIYDLLLKDKTTALNKELEDERKQLENRIESRTSELRVSNLKTQKEIEETKKAHQELADNKNRLQRQIDAMHLLTKKTNLGTGNLTKPIQEIVEIASGTMETERVSVWLYDETKTDIRCIDLYERSKEKHSDGEVLHAKNYPIYFKAIELDRVIDASDAINDSRTSEYFNIYLKPLGITSLLDAPIRKVGLMVGIVCFEQEGQQRIWTMDEQLFAGAIADSIAILLESGERIAAEKALLEKEQQLASIYNTVGDSIFVLSVESEERYKFISINNTFVATTGLSYNQVVGKYVNEIIPKPSLTVALEKYKKAIFDKKIVRWEDVSNYPSQKLIGEVSVAPIFDEKGKTTLLIGAVHDITDRKKAEIEIRKLNEGLEELLKERTAALTQTQGSLQVSEEKYRKIVEEAGDLVYSSDYNGYLTYVNPISKKITGYAENELIGKYFLDFIDPEWKMKVAGFYKKQFDNKIRETLFSFPIITKSGEKKWVEQVVVQQKNGDRITGHLAIVRDITARMKVEKALLESEEKFSKAFQLSPTGLALTSIDNGTFIDANESFLKILGFEREEVVGHNSEALFIVEPDVRKEILEELKQKESVKDKEIKLRKKTGDLTTVLFSSVLLCIKGVKSALTIVHDISKQKIAEIEITQKSEELARSNQELEQFAFVASHDLQEPLRTIHNFVGLLDKKYLEKTDEDTKQYFKFVVNATSKMQNLIKDLLDYSRVGRNLAFTTVDCNTVFKEVIAELDASIKESNTKITTALLPVLKGNDIRLKQLFQNLISNAIKFRKKNATPEITITVEQKEKEYLFAVKDNGIGIEEQYISKLFIIFQRLHADTEYPGTGIGLATCKKIVALHGGTIWVESKIGEGSTFYFTLPKAKSN